MHVCTMITVGESFLATFELFCFGVSIKWQNDFQVNKKIIASFTTTLMSHLNQLVIISSFLTSCAYAYKLKDRLDKNQIKEPFKVNIGGVC